MTPQEELYRQIQERAAAQEAYVKDMERRFDKGEPVINGCVSWMLHEGCEGPIVQQAVFLDPALIDNILTSDQ